MPTKSKSSFSISQHFANRAETVRSTYRALLKAARTLGPVGEEPKKTSIHLTRNTAFAGVATRRASLILTLKATQDIDSPRIRKREKASANRWHVEIELTAPGQVDREVQSWLKNAYELAG